MASRPARRWRDQHGGLVPGSSVHQIGREGVGRGRVEVLARLVEDQHREAGQQHAGDADPLSLAAGQAGTVLADLGVEPVRAAARPSRAAGPVRRAARRSPLSWRRGGPAGGSPARWCRRCGVSWAARPDDPADVLAGQRASSIAIQGHRAGSYGRKPQQDRGQRRLARSARTDDADPPAGRQVEVDAVQRPRAVGPVAGAQPLGGGGGRGGSRSGAGTSGSATAGGASMTSKTRAAERRTRSRLWAAAGRPATISNSASGSEGDDGQQGPVQAARRARPARPPAGCPTPPGPSAG